ncbi:hypothetical protein DYI22_00620 [Marinobacter lipolyticus]|uniref:hypothetical protein n=1 Tax=Marinobacter lipolyticus TaxID=209639 RepID=UPI001BCC20AD|nr:hypothetical protein [Marinobacter lipolyticus]MBS8239004.1 hypothetical protein [Marinobacter lipolyticus]
MMTPDVRLCALLLMIVTLAGCASRPEPEPPKEAVVALDGQAVVTLNNRALSLKEEGRFREAAELLRTGIRGAPETPELHYNLAVISELYLLDLDNALTHYRRYRSLTEQDDKLVAGWIADLERRLQ